ncbi:hypothetical protein [Kribbella italica]|uniref:Uncharacterized protein n=1 Tax=Kribbella italica TaxID=1540520 RepID=A0A7W9J8V6_9ACTN|nr:hypothetical protein [Kribbella italica]MBB5837742.1 hypothetical protein [Kribbella italica]
MTPPQTPTPDDFAQFERLVRIETKLDLSNTNHQDHETRIRRLERSMWLIAGAAAAGGGIAGQLVAPLLK